MKAAASLVLARPFPMRRAPGLPRRLLSRWTASRLRSPACSSPTPHYVGRTEALLTGIRSVEGAVPLIGCVAGSVVGGSHEVEAQAGRCVALVGG